jgi:hypothetical protein
MAASRSGDLSAMVSSRIGRRSSLTHAPAVIGDGLDDEGSGHNSNSNNNNNEPYSSSPVVIDSPTKLSSSSSAAPNEKENEPYFSDDDDEYDDSALQNILKEIPNVSRSSNELNLEPPVPPSPAQQPSSPPGKAMRRGSAFAGMGMGGSFRSTSGGSKKGEDVLGMMATEAHAVVTGAVEYCVSESKPVVWIKSDETNEPSYLELNIFLRPKRLKRDGHRSHLRLGKKSGSGTSTEKRAVGVC